MAHEADEVPGLVCVGVITAPRGLRGEVKVKSFTDDPADIAAYGALCDAAKGRRFRLKVVGEAKGTVVARIEGVADRTAAEALAGTRLYLPREALPEPADDEFYYSDLVGLAVELPDGTPFGEVRAVFDFGAGDVVEIARPGAAPVVVPFTEAVVPTVDVKGGRMVLDPPPGLLGEPEAEREDD